MSGVYARWVLPRLIDLAMRNKEVTRYRGRTIRAATGRVLEIGAGSGRNLPFYGDQVQHLYALDPSTRLLQMAGRKQAPCAEAGRLPSRTPARDRPVRHTAHLIRRTSNEDARTVRGHDCQVNVGIFAGSAIVFALALWLMRSQATVDQVSELQKDR